MEEKVTSTSPEPQQAATSPVVEAVNTPTAATLAGKKGGSGMKIVLVVLFLALIIAAGGYLYFNMQNNKLNQDAKKQVEDQTMTVFENEVSSVNVGSDDEGFSEIDQGLQSL